MLSLDELKINQRAIIKNIECDKTVKIRLLDMGFQNGEEIVHVLNSPSKLIKAYLIKNTLIAIRNSDVKNILVEVIDDENSFNRKS